MRRASLALLALAAAFAAAPPARADDLVAELARDTPVSAYGGRLAWSAYDASLQRYRLQISAGAGAPAAAPIAPSLRPFDVSLGPDAKGRVVALYTRCATAAGAGCDIYRYNLATRRESRLAVSLPGVDEAWPVQWRDHIAFVRRHRTGGRGEILDCDVPFVKTLSSPAPPRRLDRGSCARTSGLSLRRERLVEVTFGSTPSERFDSQVRVLSVRGGAARVVAHQGSGEESNVFASPSQSPHAIWLTRTGVHPQSAFVAIDLQPRTPKKTELRAWTKLTGALAVDERGSFWYVEDPGGDCEQTTPVPCRLVHASSSPFAPQQRTLLPKLTIASPAETGTALFGDPFVVHGRLTQANVYLDRVRSTSALAGVPVTLLRRVIDPSADSPESFAPTGITVTTDRDGTWSYTVPIAPSQPFYSAYASSLGLAPTYAGRGTSGTVNARITLTVTGTTFAGTIAPAQPGRTVKIQRLLSRTCQTFRSGQRFCNDRWATAGEAPVDATGTAYATTIAAPQPGTYSAALPFEDLRADPALYGGRSPDAAVG